MKTKPIQSKVLMLLLLVLFAMHGNAQDKVVAYVPNWINLNTYSTQIDYAKLTHINIAFENLYNDNGDLTFNTQDNALINAAHARGIKVLVSIGGGAASGDQVLTNRYFVQISSSRRAAFVAKLVSYVVSHNFDGIDVDLEGPSINGDYGAFIAALGPAMKAQGKLVTAALSQGYGGDKVPSSVFQHFDFINIMAYDGAGYWNPNAPGQHSSLDFAKSNTQYWLNRGLPKSKAVLGVPFYGYGFGAAFRNRDYPYNEVVNTYPGAENVDQIGSTIWYNGIPTIKAKTNYAFDIGIAGIMIWSLNYDGTGTKSLLTAIDQVFDARSNPVPQGPYNGVAISLPGTIQAENYDVGGQGVAYNDNASGNEGAVYRNDGVDIQATTDAGGGYNVGWTADGEWMEYTVNIASSGLYNIAFRSAGTTAGIIRMDVDNNSVTGNVTLPNTTGWQTWQSTTVNGISLPAGQHIVRLFVVTGGFNLNSVTVTAAPIPQAPYNGVAASIPGTIQAENYDVGGQDVAYNDLSSANEGTAYRNDGVDIQASTDVGGGHNVGWTADGEWMEYTVNITSAGLYNIAFRTASTSGGVIRLDVDNTSVTGNVSLPNTTGWQTWQTTTVNEVSLPAGQHIVRLFVVQGGFNLNSVTITAAPISNGPGFLTRQGKNIVNKAGNFQIRALNLGNFMVQEGYMLNLGGQYQHVIKQKIADVVGVAARDKFYDDYHANFITKADVDSIAKWGFNTIRLPMHYNLFTPLGQQDVYIEKGFVLVDNLLSWCKANNLYLVLDLHAAPGGQSSGDISDYVAGQPSLWESAANREQTVKLWRKFAERYANEEYIGGYDVINETNWTLPGNALLLELMKNITAAIRQVDNKHIIFVEGNSYANDFTNLTPPWDNNMVYSFHKYWNDNTDGSLNFVFSIRDTYNVPIWLGEFGENSNHWVAESVSLMNKHNIGWAIWPYKKMASVSCVSSHRQPANWSALANYINGSGAKPTATAGQAILNEWLEAVKVSNCTVNKGYLYALFGQPGNDNTKPYAALTIPGKIAATSYDEGKNGFAYSDVAHQTRQFGSGGGVYTAWNTGWYLRNDGVDIQFSAAENGPTVGWTENNEWMQYTVNVTTTGLYSVKARVAGNGGTISLAVNGTAALTNVAVAGSGGWETWQTVTLGNINLTSGQNTLRVTIPTAGYNLSFFEFTPQVVTQAPYKGTPVSIPGKIEAEEYDLGGQGIAYNDLSAANEGTAFRTDAVDIQACTDAGAGFNVGWTAAGEWLEYTVNVTTPGVYKLDARVATTGNGTTFQVLLGDQNISGTITVPNTTGWQIWQTVSVITPALTVGEKVLRINFTTGGFNLNHLTFTPNNEAPTVSLTSPVTGTNFTPPANITLQATAADADGSVAKVEFFQGSVKLGEDLTSPYSLTWSNVGAGTYQLTARASDDKGAVTTSSTATVTVTTPVDCPQLTWADEFNGTSLDMTKWSHQTGDGCPGLCGWGNNELEYYTNSTNNVSVGGGNLTITARYQPNYNNTGRNYTSGKLITAGKFSQKYGRFEARIKVPSAQGIWPAFWMLADNTQWPATGEIDILECANANPTRWFGTLHYGTPSGGYQSRGVNWVAPTALSNDFHTYTADWTTTEITWYIDGVFRGRVTKADVINNGGSWPFDNQKFYMILNVAVGGNFTGGQVPISSQYPVSMQVDYVRVYSGDPCNVPQTPYLGTVRNIPGKIEAEHYDLGGQGVAYNDGSAANEGATLRNDGVDIEATTDAGGGHNVGWTAAGEWMEYTVNVTSAAAYKLEARVASTLAGKSLRVELDGQSIGTINVPTTTGWQTWQTVSVTTPTLTAGQKTLRIFMVTDGINLNYINFAPNNLDPINQVPSVSVTSPSTGTSFTAPASISIQASASDADGNVAKVEFFNGSTKLGEDLTSPYSLAWNNVAAGNYAITARATDNSGATTTSATVNVSVSNPTNGCSGIPQYTENGGYTSGSRVQNGGSMYQCKPYPYSGWCNGAAWAYAPGSGAYWQDAWTLVQSCTAKTGVVTTTSSMLEVYPNPADNNLTLKIAAAVSEAEVKIINSTGVEIYRGTIQGDLENPVDLSGMEPGIYLIQVIADGVTYSEKLIKQ